MSTMGVDVSTLPGWTSTEGGRSQAMQQVYKLDRTLSPHTQLTSDEHIVRNRTVKSNLLGLSRIHCVLDTTSTARSPHFNSGIRLLADIQLNTSKFPSVLVRKRLLASISRFQGLLGKSAFQSCVPSGVFGDIGAPTKSPPPPMPPTPHITATCKLVIFKGHIPFKPRRYPVSTDEEK